MVSSRCSGLGSLIDYHRVRNSDLKRWRRLNSLHEKIARHEELERQRRIFERRQVVDILDDLWEKLPPTPLRDIIDIEVRRLLRGVKSKGLTRGREKKKTVAACLLLTLKKHQLHHHVDELIASFNDLERTAKIFNNHCQAVPYILEFSPSARVLPKLDSLS